MQKQTIKPFIKSIHAEWKQKKEADKNASLRYNFNTILDYPPKSSNLTFSGGTP
jgi:hypothetical protein